MVSQKKSKVNTSMVNFEDISVVVQGSIKDSLTQACLLSIRRHLPQSEIILSTWEGSVTDGFDYDILILSKDPGFFLCGDFLGAAQNNINRQIKTTLCGLQKSTRRYVLKLRSDFILTGCNFLNFYGKFPFADIDYKIFSYKIMSCVFFARNSRFPDTFLFHPSDIAFFGLRTDLLNLFDIRSMEKEEEAYLRIEQYEYCRYVPEQHIWINCLRKNGKEIGFEHQKDISEKAIEDTEKYAVSNFVYLDWVQFSLIPPKHLVTFVDNDLANVITHIEWQRLYQKYLDNSLIVSDRDPLREFIDRKIWAFKICKIFARLVTVCFRAKQLEAFREKAMNKIVRCLMRNACVPY